MTEIQEGSKVARAELVELVETAREALGELYGQGDVRFNGVTPKREGNEALDELYRRCDSLMVRAGLAETYIPAARYDAYKTRLRLLLSSGYATRPTPKCTCARHAMAAGLPHAVDCDPADRRQRMSAVGFGTYKEGDRCTDCGSWYWNDGAWHSLVPVLYADTPEDAAASRCPACVPEKAAAPRVSGATIAPNQERDFTTESALQRTTPESGSTSRVLRPPTPEGGNGE